MDSISIKKKLNRITLPIFFDIALVMMLGAVDTVMLSQYSDQAVAAVGLDNQLISFVFLIYQFVSMGAAILCAQYFGAKLRTRFMQIVGIAIIVNTFIGLGISSCLFLWSDSMLRAFGLRDDLMAEGSLYLKITGSLSFFQALSLTFSSALRSTGKTIRPMLATLTVNITNVIANYALIFGHFGFSAMGVEGAAWASAGSRIIATIILAGFMTSVWRIQPRQNRFSFRALRVRFIHDIVDMLHGPRGILLQLPHYTVRTTGYIVKIPVRAVGRSAHTVQHLYNAYQQYFSPFPWRELKKLFRIGIPAMSEEMSYSLSQITITYFINQISTETLTTKVYCTTAITFVILFSTSIVQGGDIIVGHFVGQLRYRAAYILGNYIYRRGTIQTLCVSALLAICGHTLLSFLTKDETIIRTGTWVFCIDVILSYGRVKNVFACGTLRAVGDAIYPVIIGIICQWTIAVGFAWLLGIPLGFGLIGMWIAFCMDENVRGIILMRRWHSKKWQGKSFV